MIQAFCVGRVEKYGELLKLLSLPGDEVKFKILLKKMGMYMMKFALEIYLHLNLGLVKKISNDLIKQFPNEEDGIRKYVDLCKMQ